MVYPKRRIHLPPEAPLTRLRRFVWRSLIKGTLQRFEGVSDGPALLVWQGAVYVPRTFTPGSACGAAFLHFPLGGACSVAVSHISIFSLLRRLRRRIYSTGNMSPAPGPADKGGFHVSLQSSCGSPRKSHGFTGNPSFPAGILWFPTKTSWLYWKSHVSPERCKLWDNGAHSAPRTSGTHASPGVLDARKCSALIHAPKEASACCGASGRKLLGADARPKRGERLLQSFRKKCSALTHAPKGASACCGAPCG
eukprot:gene7535-biopygen10586